MSIKEVSFQKDKLHHAYLLVGEREYWREFLEVELKKYFKIDSLSSCPDIWWQSYESFGIKDSHNLIEKEARQSFSGQGRFFILEILSITPEAQNALLKTFEEPIPEAHFFIIVRSAEIFLPTLRSRMIQLRGAEEVGLQVSPKSDFGSADKFLKLDLPDRLEFIQKEFLKSKDKSKSEIIDFVSDLEKAFRQKVDMRKITKEEEIALHEIAKCLHYLENPRSSNRLILEHLALIIPN